jgi:competence protein ComEC
MAAALLWLARRARLPELPAGIAILALLWLYVQVTGASPSSVRAWIMAAFLWGGRASERDTPALQSLALACAVTLILTPEACADAGFQLSYAAVLGIIVAGAPAADLCARPTEEERLTPAEARTATQRLRWRARKFLLGGLCVSLAATLAGAPLTLGHFGTASWGGVFVNLVLVPLSEIPLMLGMASIACGTTDWLATPASWLNGFAGAWLHGMTWIAQACATLPGLNLELALPSRWLGPFGAALLTLAFLSQAQSKSLARLLGIPAAALAGWMLLVVLLRVLS